MDLSFGYRELCENIGRDSLRVRVELTVPNHLENLGSLSMKVRLRAVIVMMVHGRDGHGRVVVLLYPLQHQTSNFIALRFDRMTRDSLQLVAFDRQFLQLGLQVFEIQTEIQKRADGHVPADAGEAVKVQLFITEIRVKS